MTGEFSLAVHALVYLNHKKTFVWSDILSENICTNPSRVRKMMAHLKQSGLVETREGRQGGGYQFVLDAKDVSLGQIADAINISFVSSMWKLWRKDSKCLISSGMADIMDKIYSMINENCKARLNGITLGDIDRHIFDNE